MSSVELEAVFTDRQRADRSVRVIFFGNYNKYVSHFIMSASERSETGGHNVFTLVRVCVRP